VKYCNKTALLLIAVNSLDKCLMQKLWNFGTVRLRCSILKFHIVLSFKLVVAVIWITRKMAGNEKRQEEINSAYHLTILVVDLFRHPDRKALVPMITSWWEVYIKKLTGAYIITVSQKKQESLLMSMTSWNIDRFFDFQNSFSARLSTKFATKWALYIPPHFKYVAALSCETIVFQKRINSKI